MDIATMMIIIRKNVPILPATFRSFPVRFGSPDDPVASKLVCWLKRIGARIMPIKRMAKPSATARSAGRIPLIVAPIARER